MYTMRKIHTKPPKKRIEIGAPLERLIEKQIKTNPLYQDWTVTDFVRFSIVQQARVPIAELPKDCAVLLPVVYSPEVEA